MPIEQVEMLFMSAAQRRKAELAMQRKKQIEEANESLAKTQNSASDTV